MKEPLIEGYTVRECPKEEFSEIFGAHRAAIFHADAPVFRHRDTLSPEAQETADALASRLSDAWALRLVVERESDGALAGWHTGLQQTWDSFYMMNSAVLPEHRRKGIYAALLDRVVERVRAEGFQAIRSNHRATNNPVLIAKLKAGFHISGMKTTDIFGLLVELTRFLHPVRQKVFTYYTQGCKVDDELRRYVDV